MNITFWQMIDSCIEGHTICSSLFQHVKGGSRKQEALTQIGFFQVPSAMIIATETQQPLNHRHVIANKIPKSLQSQLLVIRTQKL